MTQSIAASAYPFRFFAQEYWNVDDVLREVNWHYELEVATEKGHYPPSIGQLQRVMRRAFLQGLIVRLVTERQVVLEAVGPEKQEELEKLCIGLARDLRKSVEALSLALVDEFDVFERDHELWKKFGEDIKMALNTLGLFYIDVETTFHHHIEMLSRPDDQGAILRKFNTVPVVDLLRNVPVKGVW